MLDINHIVKNKQEVIERLKARHDPSLEKLVEKVADARAVASSISQSADLLKNWRNTLAKVRAYFLRDKKFFDEFADFGRSSENFLDGLADRYRKNPSFFNTLKVKSEEDAEAVSAIEDKAIQDQDSIEDGPQICRVLGAMKAKANEKAEIVVNLAEILKNGGKDVNSFGLLIRKIRHWCLGLEESLNEIDKLGSVVKSAIKSKDSEEIIPIDLLRIPNLPRSDVPVGIDENFNQEIEKVGLIRDFDFEPKNHWNLLKSLMDGKRATYMSGARFTLLRGNLAKLERSLIQLMLNIHTSEFEEISPPFLVNEEAMINSGQLPKFSEDLYRLGSDNLYLIPTGEVSLVNMFADTIFKENELPIRMCAVTPCFRREAGAAGRDNRGLIRQHQFHKVELVSGCSAKDVDQEFSLIEKSACHILNILNIPYRKIMLCTGDLGFSAEKTVDLEVWMPGSRAYREVSSVSSCGDFQGRRMKSRIKKDDGTREWVNTLNGSGLAVGRILAAVLENYQREDGSVEVPEALINLMGGVTEIV